MSVRRVVGQILIALFAFAPLAAASTASAQAGVLAVVPSTGPEVRVPLLMAEENGPEDPARSLEEIEAWHYNTDYLFGLSRGVAGSFVRPAFKPFLFLFSVPLDVALLPIAAIGGLFG